MVAVQERLDILRNRVNRRMLKLTRWADAPFSEKLMNTRRYLIARDEALETLREGENARNASSSITQAGESQPIDTNPSASGGVITGDSPNNGGLSGANDLDENSKASE